MKRTKCFFFFSTRQFCYQTLPVCCSCMTFYLSRPQVYTAACFLFFFWRWCCICLPFNLKMCKKTSSWYTKTSFNNKVNVRQLYQLWVCHLLLAICFNYVIIWRREALYSPVTPNKVKPKQDNQVLDESETMI